MDLGEFDLPFRGKSGTKRFRQIGHRFEIIEPSLIDGFEELRCSKRGLKDPGHFRPFKIEEKSHRNNEVSCLVSALRTRSSIKVMALGEAQFSCQVCLTT